MRTRRNDQPAPPAPPKDETNVAEYPVIETAGSRLILGLGDGRMFGVDLVAPFTGPLPERVQLKFDRLDAAGVPQGAQLTTG